MADPSKDITNAILTTLNSSLGFLSIPNYDNGPEPVEDYGVVGVATYNKQHLDGNHFYTDPDDDLFKESIIQDYLVRVSCSFYGETAYENAFEAQALLQMTSVQEDLYWNSGISITDVEQIQRIPEPRDTKFIDKAVFDIMSLYRFSYVKEADYFDSVTYDSKYLLEDQIVYEDTTTVTYP